MDPLSALGIVGTILTVTDTGVRVSIGLLGLAESVKTAAKSVRLIGNDVSATCGILAQLRELAQPKPDTAASGSSNGGDGGGGGGSTFCIFNAAGLQTLRASTDHCSTVFADLQAELQSASKQVAGRTKMHAKIELSVAERARWPFLQPKIRELRTELGHVKGNLVVILSIAHLAHAEKIALRRQTAPLSGAERQALRDTVVRLRQPAAASPARSRRSVRGARSASASSASSVGDEQRHDVGVTLASVPQPVKPVRAESHVLGATMPEEPASREKSLNESLNEKQLNTDFDAKDQAVAIARQLGPKPKEAKRNGPRPKKLSAS